MKNILDQFSTRQTHFGMPRVAKMSLALNLTEVGCSSSKFTHTSKRALQVERSY